MRSIWRCLLLLLLVATCQAAEEEKVVRLSSLVWPPYSGAALKEGGVLTQVLREAFKSVGYRLEVSYYPWSRAVAVAKRDPSFSGYFPEYYAKHIESHFIFSPPIGSGPLGFAERRSRPVSWRKLDDLTPYRIGVVHDYVNTEAFDKLVAEQTLRADPATSDVQNLLKLAAGRLDLAVVDRHVMNYWLKHAPELEPYQDALQFNARLLENKQLFVCFRKDEQGQRMAKLLAQGLARIDAPRLVASQLDD
ncbi:transporter substrate-binding domain-containing protein [Chitinivorax sp. PXF-14]|uniref:substrate-binding periplasmic protein n=1 Tax=Chitinivorax sp. PXF-14 TaxID=3230488 RepID=UPI003464F735